MQKAMAVSIGGLFLALMAAPVVGADESGAREVRPGDIDPGDIVRTHPDMPARGQTMEQVRAQLGAPDERVPAVGEPPISRWIYDDFTVYFEHDRVIHSVIPGLRRISNG